MTPKDKDKIYVMSVACERHLAVLRADGSVTLRPLGGKRAHVVARLDAGYRSTRKDAVRWLAAHGWHRTEDDLPDPQQGWAGEFHRRLIQFLVRNGSPVGGDSPYSWQDPRWAELGRHLEACGIVFPDCTWEDSDWWDWTGTFTDSVHEHGIDAAVWCHCGEIAGHPWRYTGTHGDLLRAITEEVK